MSEARDDGDRQAGSGSGQAGSGSGQTGSGQYGGRPAKPASDPMADFQRWLMRAGARSMANQVADNVRRSIGQQRRASKGSGDVWDTATTELPPGEPLECQWCPVCQAARRLRVSGPGLGAKLADAGGVLAGVLQDTFSVVDQMMKSPPSERQSGHQSTTGPVNGADAAHPAAAYPEAGRPAAAHPEAAHPEEGRPKPADPDVASEPETAPS